MPNIVEWVRNYSSGGGKDKSSFFPGSEIKYFGKRSVEVYSPDGSRRLVFLNFLDAATATLEVQIGVKVEGSWHHPLVIRQFIHDGEDEYCIEVNALYGEQSIFGKHYAYSTVNDQSKFETGKLPTLFERWKLARLNKNYSQVVRELTNEGYILEELLPERINVLATVSKFVEQLQNADFSTPTLVVDQALDNSRLSLKDLQDLVLIE